MSELPDINHTGRPPVTHDAPFFDEQTLKDLAADDSVAWNQVTGILLFIVTVGLVIGFTGVALVISQS